MIHPSADCEPGADVGAGTTIWRFSHVASGARVGSECMIGQGCYVAPGAVIGDRVRLQNGVSVFDGVVLEDDVFCGPNVVFTNVRRPRASYPKKRSFQPTVVRRGATVGANATLSCGIELGEYCLVGAGAVVTSDVPPFALFYGVPARLRGWVSKRGEALHFDEAGRALCPQGGDVYLRRWGSDGRVVVCAEGDAAQR